MPQEDRFDLVHYDPSARTEYWEIIGSNGNLYLKVVLREPGSGSGPRVLATVLLNVAQFHAEASPYAR